MIRENIYPHIVKEFWKNSASSRHAQLFSIAANVNALRHRFDIRDIVRVIGCAQEGTGMSDDREQFENKEEVNLTLIGDRLFESKFVRYLLPKARLLHVILTKCVTPKKGSLNIVSKDDKYALFQLLNFRKVDINDLIFNHMIKTASGKTCYPYAILLTRLLRNKGTVLTSEVWNQIPVILVKTLIDLEMKNEYGNDFVVGNLVEEITPGRVSDDSDDNKPLSSVLKRKRKEVCV